MGYFEPNPIEFRGIGRCFYILEGYRHAKKGEFYLYANGLAIRANFDYISIQNHIVRPVYFAIKQTGYNIGERVKLNEKESETKLDTVESDSIDVESDSIYRGA